MLRQAMSKEKVIIEVKAPRMRTTEERLAVNGLECGCCYGNGYFWGVDEDGHDVKVPCAICNGSGRVDAEVRIKWKAAGGEAAAVPQHTGRVDDGMKG